MIRLEELKGWLVMSKKEFVFVVVDLSVEKVVEWVLGMRVVFGDG